MNPDEIAHLDEIDFDEDWQEDDDNSALIEHAQRELEGQELFEGGDYNGMLGDATLELIKTFSRQGHSGLSAELTIALFSKLAKYEPLSELTNNPDEWVDVSEYIGELVWQNKRNPACFSYDAGRTWHHVDEWEKRKECREKAGLTV